MSEDTSRLRDPQEPVDLQVDTSAPDATPPGSEGGLGTTERVTQVITRLLRLTYPHDAFPDGPYERTAAAVQEAASGNAGDERTLAQGLAGLDRAAHGDFLALDDTAAEHLLRDRADDTFFKRIRSTAVVALYNDHEVWDLLGYEGPSYDQGGYLNRGFDDLDWLPDPRVEEYDKEPRPELVPREDRP